MSRTRALIWKEWREQRPVLLAGVAAALAMPLFLAAGAFSASTRMGPGDAVDMALPVLVFGIWPLFAAAAAATATAGELSEGTMPFLLSRPLSRVALWSLKALSALVATFLLAIVSGALLVVLRGLLKGSGFALDLSDLAPAGAAVVLTLVVVVACTLFTSNFVERPLVAGLAGLVMAGLLGFFVLSSWGGAGVASPGPLPIVGLLLLPLSVIAGAIYGFVRAEVFQASGRWRRAARALGLTLALLVGISVPLLWASLRIPVDRAYFTDAVAHPGGDVFAVTARSHPQWNDQAWLLDRDGGVHRVASARSRVVGFTTDGEWLVYAAGGTFAGLGSGEVTLRAVRLDGSHDHSLVEGQTYGRVVFAPRGDRMAVAFRRRGPSGVELVLLRASAGVERRIDTGRVELPGQGQSRVPHLAAWAWDDGSGLLLRGPRNLLVQWNVGSGGLRWLGRPFENRSGDVSYLGLWNGFVAAQVREVLPAEEGRARGFRYHLDVFDPGSGSIRRLMTREATCGTLRFIPFDDLRRVLYWTCDLDEFRRRVLEFHVEELEPASPGRKAGRRPLARLPGHLGGLPRVRGDRAVLSLATEGALRPVVLDFQGDARALPSGWESKGWISDHEILLVRHEWSVSGPWPGGPAGLAIADLGSDTLHAVYPPGGQDESLR